MSDWDTEIYFEDIDTLTFDEVLEILEGIDDGEAEQQTGIPGGAGGDVCERP